MTITVNGATIARVTEMLIARTERSSSKRAWGALVEAAGADLEPWAADGVSDGVVLLSSVGLLGRNLRRALRNDDPAGGWLQFVAEVRSIGTELDDEGRVAFDVLLQRATDPLAGLATWPLAALFAPDEIAHIESLPRNGAPVAKPSSRTTDRGEFDYTGYLTVIAKITRLCNLRCVYCHDWRAGPGQTMTFPVQVATLRAVLDESGAGLVEMIWHGGEPTVLTKRDFLRLLRLQSWFKRPGQVVANRIQTNGTRIDQGWASFFRRFGFRAGVSLDGPAEIHDRMRVGVSGTPTFARAREGITLLRQEGILNHVYLVLTQELMDVGADAIVEFLQEAGITQIGLLPVRPRAGLKLDSELHLDRATYVDFLLSIERARRAQPTPWLGVRELDEPLRAMEGKLPRHCELLGNCVGSIIAIQPDGDVMHCDKYLGDDDYVLGNVTESHLHEIVASDRVRALAASNIVAVDTYSCPYLRFCRGWCPHERYVAERYEEESNARCCGLAKLFEGLGQSTTDAMKGEHSGRDEPVGLVRLPTARSVGSR